MYFDRQSIEQTRIVCKSVLIVKLKTPSLSLGFLIRYFTKRSNTSSTRSISSFVLFFEKEKRTAAPVAVGFKADNTCEPTEVPLEQALPPEAEIFSISN